METQSEQLVAQAIALLDQAAESVQSELQYGPLIRSRLASRCKTAMHLAGIAHDDLKWTRQDYERVEREGAEYRAWNMGAA